MSKSVIISSRILLGAEQRERKEQGRKKRKKKSQNAGITQEVDVGHSADSLSGKELGETSKKILFYAIIEVAWQAGAYVCIEL